MKTEGIVKWCICLRWDVLRAQASVRYERVNSRRACKHADRCTGGCTDGCADGCTYARATTHTYQNRSYAICEKICFAKTCCSLYARVYGRTCECTDVPIHPPAHPSAHPSVHTPTPSVHWPEQILAYVILRVLEIS